MITELQKYQGCLLGFIIGNIVGKPFYRLKKKELDIVLNSRKDFKYYKKIKNSTISDDIEPSIILLRSLTKNKDYNINDIIDKFYFWNTTCPLCIASSLSIILNHKNDIDTILKNSSKRLYNNTNGLFLLRIIPIALFNKYKNIIELDKIIEEQTKLTNPSKQCIECSKILIKIIINCLNSDEKKEILIENIKKDIVCKDNIEIFNNVKKSPIFVNYNKLELEPNCMMCHEYYISVKTVIYVFLNNNIFENGLKNILSLGGNTIVNTALYGSIYGAYYGIKKIPERYKGFVILDNNQRIKKNKDIRINDSYILASILCNP